MQFVIIGLRARLQNVVDSEFAKITYTEAVDLLQSESKAGILILLLCILFNTMLYE